MYTDYRRMLRSAAMSAAAVALAAATALFGCKSAEQTGSTQKSPHETVKPLRVAVFTDAGARSVGAYRWLELATLAKDVETVPVDGQAVRDGVLDGMDVFIMPGGRSPLEAKRLGPEGREKLKAFIRNGGGYLGTCAGCCMLMQSSKCHPNMLNIIPWTFGVCGGRTDILVEFNGNAEKLAGIKPAKRRIRYAEGPVPVPAEKGAEGADIAVVATYASDVNAHSTTPRRPFTGSPAAFAGTYGKGRIFALTVHPEVEIANHDILRKAFKFVSGRDVTWTLPQRRPGQLNLGIVTDDSFGVESAKFLQSLIRSREFDLFPINKASVANGILHRLDAVIAPDVPRPCNVEKCLYGPNLEATKAFVARGGLLLAWGEPLKAKPVADGLVKVKAVPDAAAALAALREFASVPSEPAAFPRKNAKPLRVAVYYGKGGANYSVTPMLETSPEYDFEYLTPEDYAAGRLREFDVVLQPGGGCNTQYKTLGPKGVKELERFVKEGGKYYGICAGAFMALQQTQPDRARIGLTPFKADDPEHYRGGSPIDVRFAKAGSKVVGGPRTREFLYIGGPAAIPGEPVPDTDVEVLARYDGYLINNSQSKPVKPMYGKAAFLGGRVGKGKIFISCPHPEKGECNFDIVRGIFEYLTGTRPTGPFLDRVKGAPCVAVTDGEDKNIEAANFLYKKLMHDRRIDSMFLGKPDPELLRHLDAVVTGGWSKKNLTPDLANFLKRGGRIIAVEKDKTQPGKVKIPAGVELVSSWDDVIPAILREHR